MGKWILYIFVFGIGLSASFVGTEIFYASKTPKTPINPETPSPKKTLAHHQDQATNAHSQEESSVNNTSNNIDFVEDASQEIELMVDTTLPPLDKLALKRSELKEACKIPYAQYQNKSRYVWAKSYTVSKTQTKTALEFYVQEDLWSSFSASQQKRLMEDLLYCDPVAQSNNFITTIKILSTSDDSMLSSYKKG